MSANLYDYQKDMVDSIGVGQAERAASVARNHTRRDHQHAAIRTAFHKPYFLDEESPGESPAESPAESPGESPAESPGESPAESPGESPAESPGESPAESPGE